MLKQEDLMPVSVLLSKKLKDINKRFSKTRAFFIWHAFDNSYLRKSLNFLNKINDINTAFSIHIKYFNPCYLA